MTKEQFTGLPTRIALGILYEGSAGIQKLVDAAEMPQKPLPPKYDFRLFRKGGFNWASETDLEGLVYWHGRAKESADAGGQYAEKDAKKCAALERWIAYRSWYPHLTWEGQRGDEQVRAAGPRAKPKVYETEPRAHEPEVDDGDPF